MKHVKAPSIRPQWAVLVPDTGPDRVMTLLRRYEESLSLPSAEPGEPIEVWKGTGKYTAAFGTAPEQDAGYVIAKVLSQSIAGACFLVADHDALDGIALVFEGGRQKGARSVPSADAFAAELGCPWPELDRAADDVPRPFMASVVVVPGPIASPPAIEGAVFREETRRGELVTLVRRAAFSGNHLLELSRAAGERTIHCVVWAVHTDSPETFFRCSAYRAGKLVGTWVSPERASPRSPQRVPERLVGAQTPGEVLDRLGLSWADLGRE